MRSLWQNDEKEFVMVKLRELKYRGNLAAATFKQWSELAALTSARASLIHGTTLLSASHLFSALLAELEEKDKYIAELEAQLATPVRLPPADSSHRYHGAMTRFAIRKAGFKCMEDNNDA